MEFSPARTIIVGGHGSGKTALCSALLHPKPGVVEMVGNGQLAVTHRDVILSGCERAGEMALRHEETLAQWGLSFDALRETVWRHLEAMVGGKPHKVAAHGTLDPRAMAMGERVAFGYALLFAIRERLGLNIPLVLDGPYGCLDETLRGAVRDFLKFQGCQQILVGTPEEMAHDDPPAYVLGGEDTPAR